MRVAAYTGGKKIASARFRVGAYLSALQDFGISMTEFASRTGKYPPQQVIRRPVWAGLRLAEVALDAIRSHRYDVVLFQRELLSTYVTAEPCYAEPRMLDVDDAIWLHKRGSFALRLARRCDLIQCGNDFLADYFVASGREVRIVPTVVDTERFRPQNEGAAVSKAHLIIGWSGSSGNLPYLEAIEEALAVVLERFPEASVRVICDAPARFRMLSPERVEFVPWSPAVEVSALQDLAVGLMPLPDTPWARGKCAFKMLTYMACAVPVVVSPIGVNASVLAKGGVGYGADIKDDWVDALTALLRDEAMRCAMGRAGRAVVQANYSVKALTPVFAKNLKWVAGQ